MWSTRGSSHWPGCTTTFTAPCSSSDSRSLKPMRSSSSQPVPGLERRRVLADPSVPGDEPETELAEVPRLDLAHAARHEVVVEDDHRRAMMPLLEWRRWTSCSIGRSGRSSSLRSCSSASRTAMRARTLARRGTPVPLGRRLSFGLALVLAALALASPLDVIAEERLFSAHMLQHVILGDLAALAFVLGLTGPVLRPVLAVPFFARLRVLGHPLVALPIWAANLIVWHLPVLYEAALRSDAVHALQHILFFSCGALMWWPVVEVLPGPEWFGTGAKLGYVVAVRAVETVLGNVFFWAGHPFYEPYVRSEKLWGLTAASDRERRAR